MVSDNGKPVIKSDLVRSETSITENNERGFQSEPPSYVHTTLPQSHIRLLQIHSIEPEVTCSMQNFLLDTSPSYQAISYAWGTEPPSERIICDEARFAVTPNLLAGLRSIYTTLGAGWLWVDAITINQSDDVEKAEQVALMSVIYSEAERVIIWLGPAYLKSDLAMDHVAGCAALIDGLEFDSTLLKHDPTELGFPGADEQVWPAFQRLFARPWFQRLWVVQEAVLAREIVAVCGEKSAAYSDIQLLIPAFERLTRYSDSQHLVGKFSGLVKAFYCLRCDMLKIIDEFRKDRTARAESDILRLTGDTMRILEFARNQQATQPIDRVYAVLGLIDKQLRSRIPIHYDPDSRRQYWRTYVQFFKAIVDTFADGAYYFTSLFHTGRQTAELPSWCPDLLVSHKLSRPVMTMSGAGQIRCDAAWKPNRVMIETVPNSDDLRILGSKVDTVKEVVPIHSFPKPIIFDRITSEDVYALGQSLRECFKAAEAARQGDQDWEWLHKFLRTLVVNTVPSSNEPYPPEEIQQDFFACIQHLGRVVRPQAEQTEGEDDLPSGAYRFAAAILNVAQDRALFTTKQGWIGLGPRGVAADDHVAIWLNCSYPVIQRRVGEEGGDGRYKLLGWAYVDGLMGGEIFKIRDFGKKGYEEFMIC